MPINITGDPSNLTAEQLELLDSALSSFRTSISYFKDALELRSEMDLRRANYQFEEAEVEWQDGLLELVKLRSHHGND
jgi:hypothetical protein